MDQPGDVAAAISSAVRWTSDDRLAAAHGTAELTVLVAAGHRLRHDPRAVALLFGWLDRVRAAAEPRVQASM